MLDSSITLAVDATGDNTTLVDQVFSKYKVLEDKSVYRGSAHTLTSKDQIEFYRNTIKPSGNYLGNAKGTIKLTEDQQVVSRDGSVIVASTIFTVQGSVPVGTSDEEFFEIIGRLQALMLDKDLMYRVFMGQEV